MGDGFEWHTAEETGWDEEESLPASPAEPSRRRWWLLALLVIPVIALFVWLTYQQAERQVEQVADDLNSGLENQFQLLWQADSQSDLELFQLLRVNDRYLTWEDAQDQLFFQDLLFDRRPLGFNLTDEPPQVVDIELPPDLQQAQLTFEQTYEVQQAEEERMTAVLRQTFFYERRADRWLLAPPSDDFWGEWQRQEGEILTLVYSEPDAVLAEQLFTDLEPLVVALCDKLLAQSSLEIVCPPDLQLQLLLEREQGTLLELIAPSGPNILGTRTTAADLRIYLPSPTLVGQPVDEVGYQALYQNYAFRLARGLLTHPQMMATNNWPSDRSFPVALLNKVLIDVAAREWPADFLAFDAGPPPRPLPEEDMVMLCVTEDNRGSVLWVYDMTDGRWRTITTSDDFDFVSSLWGGTGVLLHRWPPFGFQLEPTDPLVIDLTGRSFSLPPVPTERGQPTGYIEFNQGRLLASVYDEVTTDTSGYFLDLASCSADCAWQSTPGQIRWSPGGQYMLVHEFDHTLSLWTGDGQEQLLPEVSSSPQFPFWLDEESYVYQAWGGRENEFTLMRGTILGEPSTLLTMTIDSASTPYLWRVDSLPGQPERALLYLIELGGQASHYLLYMLDRSSGDWRPFPVLGQRDVAGFIETWPGLGGINTQFFNSQSQLEDIQERPDWYLAGALQPSPDGRWLTGQITALSGGQITYILYEESQGWQELISYSNPYASWQERGLLTDDHTDWTTDSRWLLLLLDGLPILIEPESGYRHLIEPPTSGCYSATWLN